MGGDRAWAGRLLASWTWTGALLTAEMSRAKYYLRAERHEVLAHAEVRDPDGRRRVDIGSFPSVALAQAACERDAATRCRRDDADERPPVSVAIGRVRSGGAKADKGRELSGANYRPRDHRDLPDLDEVLAAFADVIEDEG